MYDGKELDGTPCGEHAADPSRRASGPGSGSGANLTSCPSPTTRTPLTASNTIDHFVSTCCHSRPNSLYRALNPNPTAARCLRGRGDSDIHRHIPNHHLCSDVDSRAPRAQPPFNSPHRSLWKTKPRFPQGQLLRFPKLRPSHASTSLAHTKFILSVAFAPCTLSRLATHLRSHFVITPSSHRNVNGRAGSRPTPAFTFHLT